MREDEEQNVKLTQTIDLLLAAGYFRARIKGLSDFDKVNDHMYVSLLHNVCMQVSKCVFPRNCHSLQLATSQQTDFSLWLFCFNAGCWWNDVVYNNV